jgi:hypothetical protein
MDVLDAFGDTLMIQLHCVVPPGCAAVHFHGER